MNKKILSLFTAGFVGAAIFTGCQQQAPAVTTPAVAPPAQSPATAETEEAGPMVSGVKIFLVALDDNGQSGPAIGCGDSLVAVSRTIAPTQAPLSAALKELFSIKDQNYGESGLYNSLYQSDLKVEKAVVENGKATIELSGTHALGGVCDSPRFEGQIKATALQFATVKEVQVTINGQPLEEILSGRG